MTRPIDAPHPDARALVLGLGRFGGGREAALFLARHGYRLRVADRADRESLGASATALDGLDVDWRLGAAADDPAILDGVDLVCVNPAIPDQNPVLVRAREDGLPRTQEVELFLRAYPGRVVLVTGTNGKSSTTTLLTAALRRAGVPTLSGGNIGHSLLADEASWAEDQVTVLEISSFQLERLDPERTPVEGAVFTPITRDHIDRHGSLEAYRRAKAVAARAAQGFVVHGADDAVAAGFDTHAPIRLVHRRGPARDGDAACVTDGLAQLRAPCRDPGPLLAPEALRMAGAFQVDNAMAAALAADALGASRHLSALGLVTAAPLPFRLQQVAVVRGVRVHDNAVSTSAESTRSALEALGPHTHWVGGGKTKDGPEGYGNFAREIAGTFGTAHLFGAAAEPLSQELAACGMGLVTVHDRVEAALDAGLRAARPGEDLLFSPGFASFDHYPNFRARALDFHAWLGRQPR